MKVNTLHGIYRHGIRETLLLQERFHISSTASNVLEMKLKHAAQAAYGKPSGPGLVGALPSMARSMVRSVMGRVPEEIALAVARWSSNL